MEHLLSGAAAVEEKSKNSDENTPPPSTVPSPTSSSRASNGASPTTSSCVKSEPLAACEMPALLAPLPKLPPISSLTQIHGVPPSLQSCQTLPARTTTTGVPLMPAPPAVPRHATGVKATQDEGLCRYRNKLCLHPRALKRNGELHNLCEKHRAKANQNQRKLESKRRVQKRRTRQVVTAASAAPPRAYRLTPSSEASVMAPPAMQIHHHYDHHHYQQQGQQQFHLQAPALAMRRSINALPSLAQLQRPTPTPPPPSSSSSGPTYPYYDGSNYPPYSR